MLGTLARLAPALAALAVLASAAPAAPQKLARGYYEDPLNGYKFKILDDWSPVPLQPQQQGGELINRIGARVLTRFRQGHMQELPVDLLVFRLEDRASDDGGASDDRSKSKKYVRTDVTTLVDRYVPHLRGFDPEKPTVDERVSVRGTIDNEAHHRLYEVQGAYCDMLVDTWQLRFPNVDFGVIYTIPKEHEDDYVRLFERSAKTFRRTEEETAKTLGKNASYEEMIAFYEQEAQKTPGWSVEPTPSQAYIVLTSSDDGDFVEEVIERLEASRELYMRDFPPKKELDHVSIVRICATEEEFHKYGGTGGGVAGWFNPGTTELVLYDAKNVDRNQSYAVMSHEAFHQYCHFLFDESEAHRWFDEGHGDYYGGVEFERGRAKITPHMPGGLDRFQFAKELVREDKYVPIEEHVNYSHGEWQSKSIASYAQSWSIIYYLRQGALGKVKSKVWEDEYGQVIPNYVRMLYEGYQELYAKMDEEAEEQDDDSGIGELIGRERDGGRRFVMPAQKEEIWEKAIAASWGQIDLAEFEENWKQFVEDYL